MPHLSLTLSIIGSAAPPWNKHMRLAPFVILLTSFCFQGCDFLYGMLQKEGAEEKKLVGDTVPFEKNPAVEEIQTLLKIYGYSPGSADGVMGLRTREAVARFQADNGLEVNRFVDQPTWQRLVVFKDNGLVTEDGLNIRLVQTLLKRAGLYTGKVDGKFGPRTKAAVIQFQKTRGLKADGKIGYKTLMEMAEFLPPPQEPASETPPGA